MTNQPSPFSYLSRSGFLQLKLANDITRITGVGSSKDLVHPPLLQPISCMTKLRALTLLMPMLSWDVQHLSQLPHLTSLGMVVGGRCEHFGEAGAYFCILQGNNNAKFYDRFFYQPSHDFWSAWILVRRVSVLNTLRLLLA